jgi:hypothetical protein
MSPAMSISSNSDASQDWQLGGMKRRRGVPEIARLSGPPLDPRLPPSEDEIMHQRMAMGGMGAKDLIDHPLSRHCEALSGVYLVCVAVGMSFLLEKKNKTRKQHTRSKHGKAARESSLDLDWFMMLI